jgi:hypothetical protein
MESALKGAAELHLSRSRGGALAQSLRVALSSDISASLVNVRPTVSLDNYYCRDE